MDSLKWFYFIVLIETCNLNFECLPVAIHFCYGTVKEGNFEHLFNFEANF
jgi:hypothetical protein